eukprot:SAG22_NODE_9282_length_598_cov_19.805611_1_plen_104_part_10
MGRFEELAPAAAQQPRCRPARTTGRKTSKKGIDGDNGRRNREETRTQVRKEKRDEALRIKRQQMGGQVGGPGSPDPTSQMVPQMGGAAMGGAAPAVNPDIAEKL